MNSEDSKEAIVAWVEWVGVDCKWGGESLNKVLVGHPKDFNSVKCGLFKGFWVEEQQFDLCNQSDAILRVEEKEADHLREFIAVIKTVK